MKKLFNNFIDEKTVKRFRVCKPSSLSDLIQIIFDILRPSYMVKHVNILHQNVKCVLHLQVRGIKLHHTAMISFETSIFNSQKHITL